MNGHAIRGPLVDGWQRDSGVLGQLNGPASVFLEPFAEFHDASLGSTEPERQAIPERSGRCLRILHRALNFFRKVQKVLDDMV